MAKTTFSGPVISLSGFVPRGFKNQVVLTGTANTLSVLPYVNSTTGAQIVGNAGKMNLFDDTLAGGAGTITLPALKDTTPEDPTSPDQQNDFGSVMSIYLAKDLGNDLVISCAAGDVMTGTALMIGAAGAVTGFSSNAGGGNNTITLNGSTKGGLIDTEIHIMAVSAGTWYINMIGMGSGTTITPFSTV